MEKHVPCVSDLKAILLIMISAFLRFVNRLSKHGEKRWFNTKFARNLPANTEFRKENFNLTYAITKQQYRIGYLKEEFAFSCMLNVKNKYECFTHTYKLLFLALLRKKK